MTNRNHDEQKTQMKLYSSDLTQTKLKQLQQTDRETERLSKTLIVNISIYDAGYKDEKVNGTYSTKENG